MNGSISASATGYINLAEAALLVPPGRNGRPTHTATLIRWVVDGTRSADGRMVRLQAVRSGGRWAMTSGWLDEYAARLTSDHRDAVGRQPAGD